MSNIDLTVELHGQSHNLKLKNPILTASGTFGYGHEFQTYGDLSDLGGIIVKGLSLRPRDGNPVPRLAETPAGMLNSIGLQNDGVEHFCQKILPLLPTKQTAVIANLYAGSVEEFGVLASNLDTESGLAALEINISCPNVKEGGVLFGQDAKMAAAVTASVRKNAPHKHLILKLSPNVTNIVQIAQSVEDAGADSISCINTLLGMSVDVATRRPRLANIIGGLSGPAIKPVALRCVWQITQAVKIPVIGVGGITTCEDVLEFILVGAHAVQIGTANFMRPDTAFLLARDLVASCKNFGLQSLSDLRGQLQVES